ncbi:alpha/beta hydrolase [Desulfopila sp. IMCC35006]|uniref:alpha/beta fold hydrolase n=1 Tax=Desulfopila sp. IMCC35006 TaxID=2569542 RepID=UPI0010AB6930|nr:alpha/beta hydrolase [Desulfopila sp. IMCC35006]TKB26704.1 alpha/beta hydrolase [Desulfopila sp. IMCC35006]
MKRQWLVAGALLLVLATAAAGVWFRPVPGNFLYYLVWRLASRASAERGEISYNGANIHYVAYGEGKPVLLLHGGLSNRLSWFSQIPWLVEAGRRVVLVDTRGHGKSTLGHVKLSYRLFAQDVIQVLNRLNIGQTDIIGWSDGGIIALLLGRDWPKRVGKIIAISANFDPSGVKAEAGIALQAKDSGHLRWLWLWLRGWWSGAGENFAALETRIWRLWRTAPRLGQEDLHSIHAPVLVIVGEKDVISLEHSAQLAQWLGNGRLVVIPGAGHSAPVSHAKDVDGIVASFLGIK